MRFEFKGVNWILEIQYFVCENEQRKEDLDKGYLKFAVTTDGHELLICTNSTTEEIFQREFDDVDFLDLTLSDLLKAKVVLLNVT